MALQRRVTITDALDLLAPAVDHLEAADVEVQELAAVDEGSIAEQVSGSPVLIVGVLGLGDGVLTRLADVGVQAIVRAGIGYDNVDAAAARTHGIAVANVPDYCVDEVADHTLLLLLSAARRLTTVRDLGRGGWAVNDVLPDVHRIRGQRLGLVGFGRIARHVARRALAFGYHVSAHDPYVDNDVLAEHGVWAVGLDELFADSDAVSLHCPLTERTTALVDAGRLAAMRPHAVLVNTSRGGLVDLDAVDAAVADGRLGAVALDVLAGEPHPPLDHPLLQRPEVTVTPHVAWYSLEARRELAVRSAEEALRWLDEGRFRHRVNP